MPNYHSILEQYGVSIEKGVVLEGDNNHYVSGNPLYLVPEIQSCDATGSLSGSNSYVLMPIGQKNLRPTVASSYNYVQPLVATLVAVSLGMDTFGWLKGVAVLLVFAGVYIVTISKSRAQLEAEAGRGSASR